MNTRLVNRCSSRFQSNHHRGYFRRNRIMSRGPRTSSPPAPDTAPLVPLLSAPNVPPDTVPSTIMIGMATTLRPEDATSLSGYVIDILDSEAASDFAFRWGYE